MATTPQTIPSRAKTGPPALFTKQERYALLALSLFFIAFSTLLHWVTGGYVESVLPKFKLQSTPPPQQVIVQTLLHTPKPTPTPPPTPTPTPPPPEKNTPPPIKLNVFKATTTTGTGPVERAYTPPPVSVNTAPPVIQTPTPAPAATIYAPGVTVDAQFRHKCEPEYPEIAKQQNIEGTVEVLVTIGPDGGVVSSRLGKSSGNASLDQAAMKAAGSCSTYVGPTLDGRPATLTYKVIYEFTLSG